LKIFISNNNLHEFIIINPLDFIVNIIPIS